MPNVGINLVKIELDLSRLPEGIKELIRFPKKKEKGLQQLNCLDRWVLAEKGTIKIKILCYTFQSTFSMISQLFPKSPEETKKRNIEIQVLRRNLEEPLRIWNISEENDKMYWLAVQKDAHDLNRVWTDEISENVQITTHSHLFEPIFKAIFVNDKYALIGFYVIEKHTKKGHGITSWDYIGYKTEMMEFRDSDTGFNGYFFKWVLNHFNQIWKDFSKTCGVCNNRSQ